MAMAYGYPQDNVEPLMKLYDKRIAWRITKQYGAYCTAGLGFVVLLWWLYKRGIFVISRRDLKHAG